MTKDRENRKYGIGKASRKRKAGIELAIALAIIVITMIAYVKAQPTGPDSLTQTSSSRYQGSAAQSIQARAGNVSELNIHATTVSQFWQGYYGNISGTIVLSNANNQSLYQWNDANPNGEIYASRNNSLDWSQIQCANQSLIYTEESTLNMGNSVERINDTFNSTSNPQFFVGATDITANSCRSTNAYNGSGYQQSDFYQVLLSSGNSMVYTTIIDQNKAGFDNKSYDFEMLVPEDGSNGNTATTTYYFYVEIQ